MDDKGQISEGRGIIAESSRLKADRRRTENIRKISEIRRQMMKVIGS